MNVANLTHKEHRRQLVALCKCAGDEDDRPSLANVAFDGRRVYATDSRVLAVLPFETDVPRDTVLIPARRLAKALALAGADDQVTLRFDDDEAVLRVGADTLPLEGMPDPTTVTLGYVDEDTPYPDVDKLLVREPDDAVDEVASIAFDAALVTRIGAVAPRGDGSIDNAVVLRPRGLSKPIDVHTLEGERLGLVMPLRSYNE